VPAVLSVLVLHIAMLRDAEFAVYIFIDGTLSTLKADGVIGGQCWHLRRMHHRHHHFNLRRLTEPVA